MCNIIEVLIFVVVVFLLFFFSLNLFVSGYLNCMFYHLFRNFSIVSVLQNCIGAKDNAKKIFLFLIM